MPERNWSGFHFVGAPPSSRPGPGRPIAVMTGLRKSTHETAVACCCFLPPRSGPGSNSPSQEGFRTRLRVTWRWCDINPDVAPSLKPSHEHGSNNMSEDLQNKLRLLASRAIPLVTFLRNALPGSGCSSSGNAQKKAGASCAGLPISPTSSKASISSTASSLQPKIKPLHADRLDTHAALGEPDSTIARAQNLPLRQCLRVSVTPPSRGALRCAAAKGTPRATGMARKTHRPGFGRTAR